MDVMIYKQDNGSDLPDWTRPPPVYSQNHGAGTDAIKIKTENFDFMLSVLPEYNAP